MEHYVLRTPRPSLEGVEDALGHSSFLDALGALGVEGFLPVRAEKDLVIRVQCIKEANDIPGGVLGVFVTVS